MKAKDVWTVCCVVLLGLVAVLADIVAEFKRTKAHEVRYMEGGCTLPRSPASAFGAVGASSVFVAQIITVFGGGCVCCIPHISPRRTLIATLVLFLSWVSALIAMFMMMAGAVMNGRQRSWLVGDCYVVRGGVFAASAALSFLAATSDVIYYVAVRRGALPVISSHGDVEIPSALILPRQQKIDS